MISGLGTFANVTPFVSNALSFPCLLEEFLSYILNPSSGVASFRKPSLTPPARVRFLDLGSIDILGHIILYCVKSGYPAHCRVLGGVPAL